MSLQLAIDRGNTQTKVSVSNQGEFLEMQSYGDQTLEGGIDYFLKTYAVERAILCDVRTGYSDDGLTALINIPTIHMSHTLNFPFINGYSTPETLGHDRLANMAGACVFSQQPNILVIDCGTCVTYSMLSHGRFLGGTISPGVQMRFMALHHFTGQLPLLQPLREQPALVGDSTQGSIRSGVEPAIIVEVDAMIASYRAQYNSLQVLLTGGDYSFFENTLKSSIFAVPQLTQLGLHETLRLNPC